jgi:hypothetical protein
MCWKWGQLDPTVFLSHNRNYIWTASTSVITNTFWSNVESLSTALSILPDPMSSNTRQRFLLYQVQFQVTLDSVFRCTRSNVESISTALSILPGPMSSNTRQRFLLYQVQCRVTLDSFFRCTRSNVGLKSTLFLQCLILVFTKLYRLPFKCEFQRFSRTFIWSRLLIIWSAQASGSCIIWYTHL